MPLTLNVLSLDRLGLDGIVTRVSTAANGTQADSSSKNVQLSADGRYATFTSNASNLGGGVVSRLSDIFRKDLWTGKVELLTKGWDGSAANGLGGDFSASADGSRVAFVSAASNLVEGDGGIFQDIFVKDFATSSLISITAGGNSYSSAPVMSANGRFVMFESAATNLGPDADLNGKVDLFVRDLQEGTVRRFEQIPGATLSQIGDDGETVLFATRIGLIAGDGNGAVDIYRKNLGTGIAQRLSVGGLGQEATGGESVNPRLSADGHYLVFESAATNLVEGDVRGKTDIFRKDLVTGTVERVSIAAFGEADGDSADARISTDGRYVTFESRATNLVAQDVNNSSDIFRKDMVTGIVERLSAGATPAQGKVPGNGASEQAEISAAGRYVTFTSTSTNLVAGDGNSVRDVFRKDLATGEIVRVSIGSAGESNAASGNAHTSVDGQVVAFESGATNLLPTAAAYSNVFVRDLRTGSLVQASATADGAAGGAGDSSSARLSADGTRVVFQSTAGNLVTGDSKGWSDIFLRDMSTPAHTLVRVSTGAGGVQAEGDSYGADLSADGSWVVFDSTAPNLVAGDTRGYQDVFLKDVRTPNAAPIRVSVGPGGAEGNNLSLGAKVNVRGTAIDVVFTSFATNLLGPNGDMYGYSDVFVYRSEGGTSSLVRASTGAGGVEANSDSSGARISADGRYVAFTSIATNLVAGAGSLVGKSDVFVKDLDHPDAAPVLVSAGASGVGNNRSSDARISADGRFVTFTSTATNLVAGDTNNSADIFRKDLVTGAIERLSALSVDRQGLEEADGGSVNGGLSGDGRLVVLGSYATNLVAGDTNRFDDLFLVDTARLGEVPARADGRVVAVRLGVGAASSVDIAWGDGTAETVIPSGGVATLSHVFADKGTKDALVTVHEGAQAWAVHHNLDVASGTLVRNTALADTLTGGEAADALTGDGFANVLVGRGGNDTLDGAGGADTLQGGAGDDTYRLDSTADVIVEAAGGGADTAIVSLDFNMGALANVETIKLADGTVATRVTGGAGNDHLIGNTNFNIIDGAGGADTMEGGAGSDVFLVDNAADLVVEAAGGGRDAVQAGVSYALSAGAEIEVMTALGAGAIALTGSNSANTIHGNAGANVLKGLAGNDVLHGGAGRDQLWGGVGRDTFVFDTRPNTRANPDKVRDFSVRDDSIWLDNGVMTKLGRRGSESNPVKLNKAFFALDTAKDGNDYVIYKKSTGVLYYDPDGNGAKAAVQLATLNKNLKIKATDFFVV